MTWIPAFAEMTRVILVNWGGIRGLGARHGGKNLDE